MRRRASARMRPVVIKPAVSVFAEGSALIQMGRTQVHCTASIEESVPRWREKSKLGWVTAEYGMLPRATSERTGREAAKGRVGGRTAEIQRLIGRALRAVVDFQRLGPRTITLDCDVLQADGGTRTAAITGGYVALACACAQLRKRGLLTEWPLLDYVAAVSVGVVEGQPLLDLEYADDVRADVDMNIVMAGGGRFIEVQGTAEHNPFDQSMLLRLLALAKQGIADLIVLQRRVLQRARV
ncbi:MAG: ribonuclease PH [Deltaproteobacteria bacterium]|nr:ribonuclease PH [Deltaproteobacteria bacterium]